MNEVERKELADKLSGTKNEEIIREIVRLGEAFLTEQLRAGLASDSRSMSLALVLSAVLAGLIGGTATLMAAEICIGIHGIALGALGIPLFVSTCMAIHAARPTPFNYSGNNPRRWAPVVGDGENLVRAMAVQASFYSKGIAENGTILRENHKCIRRSLNWALGGIVAGAAVEILIVLSHFGQNGFGLHYYAAFLRCQ